MQSSRFQGNMGPLLGRRRGIFILIVYRRETLVIMMRCVTLMSDWIDRQCRRSRSRVLQRWRRGCARRCLASVGSRTARCCDRTRGRSGFELPSLPRWTRRFCSPFPSPNWSTQIQYVVSVRHCTRVCTTTLEDELHEDIVVLHRYPSLFISKMREHSANSTMGKSQDGLVTWALRQHNRSRFGTNLEFVPAAAIKSAKADSDLASGLSATLRCCSCLFPPALKCSEDLPIMQECSIVT